MSRRVLRRRGAGGAKSLPAAQGTPHPASFQGLAPRWHTALLVLLILSVALTGVLLARAGSPAAARAESPADRITTMYLPMILVQWALAFYVARVARTRSALGSLLGHRSRWTFASVAGDLALAGLGWGVILAVQWVFMHFRGEASASSVTALLPHGVTERLVWVVVAVSAGFSEELVYRGYLQTQLGAYARSPRLGVALQAVLFGIAHADQGARGVVRLALYGVLFGVVARWRRSLWPAIACHVWTDLASGLLR